MTHHVQFPPYLPQDKIDVEPYPVDAAERPVLGQTVPRIEHHVPAAVQLILRQKTLLLNGNASSMEKSGTTSSPDLCVCGSRSLTSASFRSTPVNEHSQDRR